ncbi:phytoene desaturase [Williamsia limnetica]|uniref:Phytoene desaturase n=1 Tax=Williamsia limnetica TaxID=882452 RepID=A0A318RI22_WILLI|nr:phytoene desaturase family protein [Williamsia limnetica]PYE15780.1 phytoene desaturase [Williamsia limnetica]
MVRTVSGPTDRIVVIGAGLSGLTAALYLRGAGREVTVLEAAPHAGGRVATETIADNHFDTGATILTMPELVHAPLAAVGVQGEEAARRLDLIDVDPTYHMRYADGAELAVHRDRDRFAAAITDVFGVHQARGYRDLAEWLTRLYAVEMDTFIDRNFDSPLSLARDPATRTGAAELMRLGALGRLSARVGKFVTDERLLRAFTFQALYAGVPPERARAVYAVIAHMDISMGVFYPRGGMGRVAEVMTGALRDAGGRVELDTAASSMQWDGNRVTSVTSTDGRVWDCDAAILTTDSPVTERLLGHRQSRRSRRITYSPSAVVAHGVVPTSVTAEWPGGHHTLDFGAAWSQTFRELTARRGRGALMSDPSLLINRPGLSDPAHGISAAGESVTVLAPCPNLDSASLPWEKLAGPYVQEVLSVLERRGYTGIRESFSLARVDHPGTWAAAGMAAGTPFAAAHTVSQTGPLRTRNLVPGTDNVVLAGSSTVPGVGIPPVLVSGRLASQRITGR